MTTKTGLDGHRGEHTGGCIKCDPNKPPSKAEQKRIDKRVELAYYASCQNIQINVLDISKVFAVGRTAIAEDADEDTLKAKIREFVETIRKN